MSAKLNKCFACIPHLLKGLTMFKFLTNLIKLVIFTWWISGCNGTDSNSAVESPIIDITATKLKDRSYILALPSQNFDAAKSYKLLLAFHGSGQSASSMKAMTSFESLSDNYIVAYPQAKVEEWNEGCDCNKPHRLGIDDLAFVGEVVADVKSNYNVIDNEIYAVGFSQGGLFTQNLMCNSKLKFNGVASVASPMSVNLSQQCEIENNTNYLMVHGKEDKTLPFTGLVHSNWGLISSESAIELIANKNDIETQVALDTSGNITKYTYKNESNINQLVAIAGGFHSWGVSDFNTTNEVLSFFDSVSNKKLDIYSNLYRTDQQNNEDVHVRSMGLEHAGPAVILLSGFNKYFHSDSALLSLLQPLIAKTHRVHVIERHGNGFSSFVDQPSYTFFAPALDKTLAILNEEQFILVSFASANILAKAWQDLPNSQVNGRLKGMVWIDPDILLPYSISLYQDWPVYWYREKGNDLIEHIQAGNWTQKAIDKTVAERTEVTELIPSKHKGVMDWPYYDLISQQRASINKQLNRAKEIMNYHDDIEVMLNGEINTSTPITVIDTDFELKEIANAETESVEALTIWHQEGSQWSQMISEKSGGQYIPLENSDHMAVFQHPDAIVQAITHLSK